nr:broad-complex [Galeruca daurica]
MVDTQHFCLRWNNYQSSITSAFENLRDDEDFVDVTLACDGKSLKAHRVVLSACSPYFRELLKSTPCKHPVIVLQDVAWTDLHALVEFIYHGEVNVHQRSLSSFLKTAEVLRVSGLTQQHGDGREQLAQVQSMVRSQQHSTPVSNHHSTFTDKLVEDSLFTSPSSPPHGATVNQLLRRAALQYRRERRISMDPDNEHKRTRIDHIMGNNNNNNNNNNELNLSTTHSQHLPPQTQPADFSPSAMKNNVLNLNLNSIKTDTEVNNGISSTDREASPCSPSPTLLHSRCNNNDNDNNNIKNEPIELLCNTNQDDNSNDSADMTNDNGGSGPHGGPLSGSSGGGGDHDDHDSAISPYLTPTESKLFATAAGSFNFSMAALAGDTSMLGGLNQSLQGNDSLAGTSQAERRLSFPLPLNASHRCDVCGKLLSTKLTLKRHKEQQHLQPLNSAVCCLCRKVFRTLNSLNNHRSIYHRRQKDIHNNNPPVKPPL